MRAMKAKALKKMAFFEAEENDLSKPEIRKLYQKMKHNKTINPVTWKSMREFLYFYKPKTN